MSKSTLGLACGLAAASIWGAMYVVSKVVLDVIPPFSLILSRLILGSFALWLMRVVRGNSITTRGLFWRVFAVGILGYGISLGFQFVGTELSTAANGALVTSATPAFVLLFAGPILRERITRQSLAALGLASLGVLAVIDPRTASLDGGLFWGNLCLLAAALTWALYSVLIRVVTRDVNVVTVTLVAFLGGLPVAVPAAAFESVSVRFGSVTVGVVLGVLFLGLISTALAMVLWNTAFAWLDAGLASLTFFAQPVVGTVLGWALLGERITPLFLAGGVLIAAGLVTASRQTGT